LFSDNFYSILTHLWLTLPKESKDVTANTALGAFAQKYWVSLLLLLLVLVGFAVGYVAVLAALVFTFLVPGLIGIRFFRLKSHELWAFVPLFSVLVSVQLVYYLSLALGYSKETVLLSFLALTASYALVVYKKGEPLKWPMILKLKQIKKTSLLLFAVIFLVSLIVLVASVWRGNQYGIIVTGSNWQDTPFHFEIIESLNQGNFPPQTPNYVGTQLSYHYFIDFHTAIVEKLYGYLPSVLPVLNALFILVFGFAVYALARPYGRRAAVVATVISVFGWGLSYVGLFSALFSGTFSPYQNYIYQFGETFGLPSMFDNLLQQRPLLVGLPAFALVSALLRDMEDKNRLILAGVIVGLTYQFHNVAFFCCYVAFGVCLLLNFRKLKLSYLYFALPSVFALPFIFFSGSSFNMQLSFDFLATYVQNPLIYYPLNLGVPFALAIISFFKRGHEYLKITMLLLVLIPNILLFTPWSWDMYKFFMFAWVPIAVLSGILLNKTRRIIVVTLVLLSVITSASVIIYNVGTDYSGATWNEYDVGLWVRDNTPQDAVFLTYYGIHEPPTMIGGRVRVSSYIYWPYGHGVPLDEVWGREQQIDQAYNGTVADLAAVVREYNVSYVYFGNEELDVYGSKSLVYLDSVGWLTKVYVDGNLRVYEVDYAKMGS
jgi:hypothetical protein